MYNETDVTNAVLDAGNYLLPLQSDMRSYQLYGFGVQSGASRFHFDDFAEDNLSLITSLPEIPYEATTTGKKQK
jgi:hypothetical protein